MKKSKDERVQKYLDELAEFKSEAYNIVQSLRQHVLAIHPRAKEGIKYGGIVFFFEDNLFGGIFISQKHISLEFSNGAQMTNEYNLLEGAGKYRRHLKFISFGDIKLKHIDYYIQQALIS